MADHHHHHHHHDSNLPLQMGPDVEHDSMSGELRKRIDLFMPGYQPAADDPLWSDAKFMVKATSHRTFKENASWQERLTVRVEV